MANPPSAVPTKDVAADVPLPSFESDIGTLIAVRAAQDPARAAVRFRASSGKWTDLSWGDLDRRRLAIATALRGLGVGPGDRVAFVSDNRVEMLLAELAVLSLGAVAVPIFPDYAGPTPSPSLRANGARVLLCGTASHPLLDSALSSVSRVCALVRPPTS